MFPVQIPKPGSDEFSRCEERKQPTGDGENPDPTRKTDVVIKASINFALWKDDVLRAAEYDEIDVHVKSGVVYLSGHIVSAASQSRIENAIRTIPGIEGIKNNLVLDDKLTLEVAAALGELEHINDCKFFTGVSHGVVSVDGVVENDKVKLLAEQCAANNPNVRGVISNIRTSRDGLRLQSQPFLQPVIGEYIYFLDGVSGVVKQVIINPNNRRVIAMIIRGNFTDPKYEFDSLISGTASLPQQFVTVPMSLVRYLTTVSGFLHISSSERKLYKDFDPGIFFVPNKDWVPPYPYCPDDILFPIEYQNADMQIAPGDGKSPFGEILEEQSLTEELAANDSPGG
jgi:osmotically-inducible protein OsmY